MKKGIYITKIDAALRQLETAITIWFNNGDSVSIHTLCSAAYQIIYDLNKHQKGPRMTPDSELIKPDKQKEWKKALKEWSNFLKHADKDPAETIFFNLEVNEYILYDAVTSYSLITGGSRPLLQCFQAWFILTHLNLFEAEYIDRITKTIPINHLVSMSRIEFFQYVLPIITSGQIVTQSKPPDLKCKV